MTIAEFKNRLILDGIESVKKDDSMKPHEKDGSIEGFNMCRKINSPEDFEKIISERRANEHKLIDNLSAEEVWEYKYATIQIEYVYERLKVAWSKAGLEFSYLSANAVLDYQRIITKEIDMFKSIQTIFPLEEGKTSEI